MEETIIPKSKCAGILPDAISRGAEISGICKIAGCACARFRNAHFAAGARRLSLHSPRQAKCSAAFFGLQFACVPH